MTIAIKIQVPAEVARMDLLWCRTRCVYVLTPGVSARSHLIFRLRRKQVPWQAVEKGILIPGNRNAPIKTRLNAEATTCEPVPTVSLKDPGILGVQILVGILGLGFHQVRADSDR